jgi:hypothetical protein
MRFRYDPVKIGAGIFLLILVSVIGVLAGFWDVLTMRERATVTIGSVGALGTAALALATFWTIKQNEETLEDLEKERRKPVVLDFLAEVIDPIIERAEDSREPLRAGRVWGGNSRNSSVDDVRLSRPPSYRDIEVSIWHKFEEEYPDLYEKCITWWNQVDEVKDAAGELAEALFEADEYDGEISDRDKAVRTIMNAVRYSEGSDRPVDDVEEYRRTMYRNYPELHHQYWRSQWELLQLVEDLRSETIDMKRGLQAEYGISNREITEYQNVS